MIQVQIDFVIKLKENIFVEDDTNKNCMNYPYGKYESFNAWNEDFLQNAIPTGLVQIWSVNSFGNVTTQLYVKNITYPPYDYGDLADGTQKSSCLLPCSTINIESRLLAQKPESVNNSVINLTFPRVLCPLKPTFSSLSLKTSCQTLEAAWDYGLE